MSGAQVTATSSESAQEEVCPLRVLACREGGSYLARFISLTIHGQAEDGEALGVESLQKLIAFPWFASLIYGY